VGGRHLRNLFDPHRVLEARHADDFCHYPYDASQVKIGSHHGFWHIHDDVDLANVLKPNYRSAWSDGLLFFDEPLSYHPIVGRRV
jgi:hypothetical protein